MRPQPGLTGSDKLGAVLHPQTSMVVMVADEEAQMIPKCSPSCFGSAQFALQD